MKAIRELVYACINGERDYQDKLWNATTTPTKGIHEVAAWLAFIHDYTQEAIHQVGRGPDPAASEAALRTVRKIAALAVACMEQCGSYPRESDPPKPATPRAMTAALMRHGLLNPTDY